jgi:hypothetical protein
MHSMAEGDITGRAKSCESAEQRSLNLSTKTGGVVGGNRVSASSQALSIHGQSNLCPLSSFKLNTKAAFSTEITEKIVPFQL